jgi:poly(A) polymerase Pap1
MEYLLIHSRFPSIFQHLLSFIRSWAQHVGLYGRAYGYLSGYSWAILCAHICHVSSSLISSLSSIEHFSIDDFFSLVHKFFSTYAQFPWSAQSFRLHPTSSRPIIHSQKSSAQNRGAMGILSPSPPFNNTGRSTFDSTRDLIVQGFQRVVELLDQINTSTSEDKANALKQILELNNDFPNSKIKSLVQLTLSCESEHELDEWIGWMKSRLAYFLNDCEEKCHLSFQTQNTTEHRSKNAEAFYSIGFQLNEETLNHHQTFNNRLNKFLDQFNLYPNRKETMKVSHKLISIHDWKLEQMQPKPQRTRK